MTLRVDFVVGFSLLLQAEFSLQVVLFLMSLPYSNSFWNDTRRTTLWIMAANNSIYLFILLFTHFFHLFIYLSSIYLFVKARRLNDVFSATKVPKYDYVLVINLTRNKPDLPRSSNCKLGTCYETMIYDSWENSETQTPNQTLRCRDSKNSTSKPEVTANLLLFCDQVISREDNASFPGYIFQQNLLNGLRALT